MLVLHEIIVIQVINNNILNNNNNNTLNNNNNHKILIIIIIHNHADLIIMLEVIVLGDVEVLVEIHIAVVHTVMLVLVVSLIKIILSLDRYCPIWEIRIIIFIFTDEASECGDAASSANTTSRKHRDWAAQVESEQQQEAGYSTDSMIHSATLPRGAGGRGGRRGWKRGRPPLPMREGVHK